MLPLSGAVYPSVCHERTCVSCVETVEQIVMPLGIRTRQGVARAPGRPRNKWLDQLRNDSTRPTGELWRRAVDRGHGGATTRRPSLATRP